MLVLNGNAEVTMSTFDDDTTRGRVNRLCFSGDCRNLDGFVFRFDGGDPNHLSYMDVRGPVSSVTARNESRFTVYGEGMLATNLHVYANGNSEVDLGQTNLKFVRATLLDKARLKRSGTIDRLELSSQT